MEDSSNEANVGRGTPHRRGSAHGWRLSARISVLLAVLLVLALGSYTLWDDYTQQQAADQRALAEAKVLRSEIKAIWDYINENQVRMNYNSDGAFDFKGIYCTVAGKNIAQRFMAKTDYVIRFVRESPRSATDVPDAFESSALALFESGEGDEMYDIVDGDSGRVLRYVSVLRIEGNCLTCHGEPAGEKDLTGYFKEGMELGSVGGAVSISIPVVATRTNADVAALLLFAAVVAVALVVTHAALRVWMLRPLKALSSATAKMSDGDLAASQSVTSVPMYGEIGDLRDDFVHMSHELSGLYGNLEAQVADRTKELDEANVALQDANLRLKEESAFKTNFLAIMNHELKTPLSSIVAVVEAWEKRSGDMSEDDRYMVQEILANCDSLYSMITNTVDAARLEAGRFEVVSEEVDVVDVAAEVSTMAAPIAEKAGISYSYRIDPDVPVITSDWDILLKILTNLVSNALKFTGSGGSVELSVSCDEGNEGAAAGVDEDVAVGVGEGAAADVRTPMLRMTVSDTGIGISQEDMRRIFEPFVQADSSASRRYGGSGLGLSLVRDLAALLGGTVEVRSEIGQGSTFVVRVPIRPNGPERADDVGTDSAGEVTRTDGD